MGAPELIILIVWIGFTVASYNAGKNRRIGSTSGFWLGLLLGIIGLIIVLCSGRIQETNYYDDNSADQLLKYKQLLDAGAITETEYNIKKGELLNR